MARPSTIYQPSGRAREYADLALNLFNGCPHGCAYCYAPRITHTTREEFHREAVLRPGILEALAKDAPKFAGSEIPVHLCFTCDPFPAGVPQRVHPTVQALRILKAHNIPAAILTKGRPPLEALGLLAGMPGSSFGVSLTAMSCDAALEWEPHAASPGHRLHGLELAYQHGIRTWVSLEPIIDPRWTEAIIERTYRIVGHYKLGRLNYHADAALFNWPKVRDRLVSTLTPLGFREGTGFSRTYLLKQSLKEA